MSKKICPFCKKEMKCGYINASGSSATYWLPEKNKLLNPFLSNKSVNESGGFILGKATKMGFLASQKLKSYYCSQCKILITYHANEQTDS